jgi:pyruvate formate-lyase activating enzyme-like uncharacterized protein
MKNLRLVEIELFNYCNRECEWCPNSLIDRKSNFIEIDNNVLKKILIIIKILLHFQDIMNLYQN